MRHGLDTICRRCHRTSVGEWSRANRDRRRKNDAKRRAAKRARIDPRADHAVIRSVYEDAHYASLFTGEPYAVDHRIPLCRGGMHSPHNLRHIPASLNAIKGGRLDHEVEHPAFRSWLMQSLTGPVFEEVVFVVVKRSQQLARQVRAGRLKPSPQRLQRRQP
jgi:hypothetical protein